MEKLHNGYILELSAGAFPLSTDSVALAHFAKGKPGGNYLDLGSGCGTLGLLLCSRDESCQVTGVEIDPAAHEMAVDNAKRNQISHRLSSICNNIESIPNFIKPGSFSCCISNPPYFSGGPQSTKTPVARREDLCNMEMLMTTAAWALKYGGDFYLVHRPERLAQLFANASARGLEPKKLLLLRHQADGPVSLVLVQCRKGGKPGLIWQEEFLFDKDGQPSAYYRSLYPN